MIKSLIKRTPVLGALAVRGGRALGFGRSRKRQAAYVFERSSAQTLDDPLERLRQQLLNLLNYTKTSGSSYSAQKYPAGYHTIVINGMLVQGQRDPRARLALVPVDLHGKSVLDIGSNQGGMLFALEQPKWGVGIDFDSRMVNVANRLRDAGKHHALNFFVFDLEKEPLALIHDFLPEPKVDVAFLLSVCMWLKNWREVVDFAASVSEAMLFETNGTDRQQTEQEEHLRGIYRKITTLAAASDDDPKQKRRKLLYCEDCRLSDRR